MNKLLSYPLLIMMFLSLFAFMFDLSSEMSPSSFYTFEGVDIFVQFTSVTTLVGIIGLACTGAVVSGITILGSGISTYSQRIIFNILIFGGLWSSLSLITLEELFSNNIFLPIWMFLTLLYIIGFAGHVGGADIG